jgi:hypothetical protein
MIEAGLRARRSMFSFSVLKKALASGGDNSAKLKCVGVNGIDRTPVVYDGILITI